MCDPDYSPDPTPSWDKQSMPEPPAISDTGVRIKPLSDTWSRMHDVTVEGCGTPEPIYYGREFVLTLPRGFDAEYVKTQLDGEWQPLLQVIYDEFSQNWNGRNMQGSLTPEGSAAMDVLQNLMHSVCAPPALV